jgi:hypothetical protein
MSNKETETVLVTITYLENTSPVTVQLNLANYNDLVAQQLTCRDKVIWSRPSNVEGLPCIIQLGKNVCGIVARKLDDSE